MVVCVGCVCVFVERGGEGWVGGWVGGGGGVGVGVGVGVACSVCVCEVVVVGVLLTVCYTKMSIHDRARVHLIIMGAMSLWTCACAHGPKNSTPSSSSRPSDKPRKLHTNGHVNLPTSSGTTGTSAIALLKQQRACEQPCPILATTTSSCTTGT